MAEFTNMEQFVGIYNSSLPTLSDGQVSGLQLDENGRLLVAANLNVDLDHTEDSVAIGDGTDLLDINADGSINVILSDGTDALAINGDGSLNVVESNSGDMLTSLQLLDDAVFSVDDAAGAADAGFHVLAVRDDALAALTEADGDYSRLRVNNQGALWVKHDGTLTVAADGGSFAVTQSGAWTVAATQSGTWSVEQSGSWTVGISGISDGTDSLDINADGSINAVVTATDLDIRDLDSASDSVAAVQSGTWTVQQGGAPWSVSATDLDIRDLSHATDSVKIGDGVEFLAVNADGSINVNISGASGTEADASTDQAGDGLFSLTGGSDVILSISVPSGTTYNIKGWDFVSNEQCSFKLEKYNTNTTTVLETIRVGLNSGAAPAFQMLFQEAIEVVGGDDIVLRVTANQINGSGGLASAGINGFTT